MTITYLENVRVPSERAHAYQIVHTCAGLAACGHAVTLLTPARTTEETFSFFGLSPTFTHERLRCFDPLTGRKRFKALAYAAQRFFFVRALRGRLRSVRSDVWYTRDPALIDALSLSGSWVLELHDAPSDLRRWKRVQSRVARFVAISEGIRRWLLDQGVADAQITVAQDGFDPTLFSALPGREEARVAQGLPSDAFVLVYSGACYPWKGVDVAVKAWSRVPTPARLVLIGGAEDDYVRLRALVPAEIRDRVSFLPSVSRAELAWWYAAADMGLLSTSPAYAIGRLYTSPLKLFEYLAAGLPVIASDVPSSHDVLTPEVARFFSFTDQSFTDTVTAVIHDDTWRRTATAHAPIVARPYTWAARAKRISGALFTL